MPIPDLHPFVVHFPIALCSLGSVAGLGYLFWQPRTELHTLTWWPLLLGWIGALIAVVTGLLAQSNLPPTAPYRLVLNIHIYAGFGMTILYAVPLYRNWIYRNRSKKASAEGQPVDLLDEPQARLWLAVCFALGLALVVITGAFGGQLVHYWGVNVQGAIKHFSNAVCIIFIFIFAQTNGLAASKLVNCSAAKEKEKEKEKNAF